MNIGILIYQDVEVLDFAGPFEVFSTANRFLTKPHQVCLIGENQAPVIARGGMQVMPHYCFASHPKLELLLVPGGVHDTQMDNERLLQWIAQQSQQATWVASVCTGAFLLAKAGVLDHQQVTTHWQDIAELKSKFPQLTVKSDCRWVEDGRFITSAGISAGIDMSLQLVSLIADRDIALTTAEQMEYDWQSN
ncbi:DJ-1/PfpI family protein [Thalassotalea marina]|uniref:Glutamine amidotransferase n=1 Tax=Thalassotalea marina TaxID=1673741 RepID=A0A919BRS4_9GAMM|nr:DJ-1/PfpI family protein [Thalassotalea marina]GHG05933.1 glutamine amidotransferase [Thalassotalea marina]